MVIRRILMEFSMCLGAALAAVGSLAGADGPRVIPNPEGGRLLVRQFPKPGADAAVDAMLKSVAELLGDRPRLGRLLMDRRDHVLMGFLEVKAGPGRKAHLGLVLVAPSGGGQQAAVILDEAQRFPRTEPEMLRTLFGGEAPSPSAPTVFPDRSGQVSLPQGWRIAAAAMGSGVIDGPGGEKVMINLAYPMIDPRSPYARFNPGSAPVPWGGDLAAAWAAALPIRCRQLHLPMLDVHVAKVEKVPVEPGWSMAVLEGTLDRHDGLGTRAFRARLSGASTGKGVWTLYETSLQIPQALAAQSMPAASAVAESFRMNDKVIRDATQARLQRQKAAFERQQAGYRARQAANDAQHAGYWARQDSNARQSQGFQNYLLDRTVVVDTQENRRGTLSDSAAASLIKADPGRFQEVPTSQYLKGWDY